LQLFDGCFALFDGAAAEENVLGCIGEQLGCEFETDTAVCCSDV